MINREEIFLKTEKRIKRLAFDVFREIVKDLLKSACIATMTVMFYFLVNTLLSEYRSVKDTENKFQSISLGERYEYVESILGIPRFNLLLDEDIQTCFYVTDLAIFRCIYYKDELVGYTCSLVDKDNSMKLTLSNLDIPVELGNNTFYEIADEVGEVQAKLTNGGGSFARSYYRELYYLTGVGHFSVLIMGVEPVGFLEKNGFQIIEKGDFYLFNSEAGETDLQIQRNKTLPNSVGLIYDEYIKYLEEIQSHPLWIACVDNLAEGRLKEYNEKTDIN